MKHEECSSLFHTHIRGGDYTRCVECDSTWKPFAEKPPIGLRPEHIWIDARVDEIRQAIARYIETGRPIPHEWLDELARRT